MKNKKPKQRFSIGDKVYYFESYDKNKILCDTVIKVVCECNCFYYYLKNDLEKNTSDRYQACISGSLYHSKEELILDRIKYNEKSIKECKKYYFSEVKEAENKINKLKSMLEKLSENKATKTAKTTKKNK